MKIFKVFSYFFSTSTVRVMVRGLGLGCYGLVRIGSVWHGFIFILYHIGIFTDSPG